MEHRKQHVPLIVAVGLLALGSGCTTLDANKAKTEAKKPDVTQPGVLPPPQEMVRPASAVAPGGGVVPAGGVQSTTPPMAIAPPAVAPAPSTIAKLTGRGEKKIPATNMAIAWRNRIEYLPDPSRNGAMGGGLTGQMFLFGGPNMEFALADGTLTVDLIDETPRPPGQPAATPERWQLDKNTLRNLKMSHETFGKSYLLFLPWPAYKPDITKVRISARYDPENGYTLYAPPSVVSIDNSVPVWDSVTTSTPIVPGAPRVQGFGPGPMSQQPIGTGAMPPMGGPNPVPVGPNFGGPAPFPLGGGPVTPGPIAPGGGIPGSTPDGLAPIAITVGRK